MPPPGEVIPNGTPNGLPLDAQSKFVNPADPALRLRMSASNSMGYPSFQGDGQKQVVAPSMVNTDNMSNGFSCGSLSQLPHPGSHQTGPSQKQQDVSRSSVSSNVRSHAIGQFGNRQFDHFKGNGLPNLDYQAGGNIQF